MKDLRYIGPSWDAPQYDELLSTCEACEGKGKVVTIVFDNGLTHKETCDQCKGSGQVWPDGSAYQQPEYEGEI